MIIRIWHGWVTDIKAAAYQKLLEEEIFKEISEKNIAGFLGIQLGCYLQGNEVEFITIMKFETLQAIIQFAGEDYKKAYVPDKAKRLLVRYDLEAAHYTIVFP